MPIGEKLKLSFGMVAQDYYVLTNVLQFGWYRIGYKRWIFAIVFSSECVMYVLVTPICTCIL